MFLFQLIRTCRYSCYIYVNRDSVIMSQWKGVLYSRCHWRELCTWSCQNDGHCSLFQSTQNIHRHRQQHWSY